MSLIDRIRPQVREPRLHLRDDFWKRKHRKTQQPLSIVPNDEPMQEVTQSPDYDPIEGIEKFERMLAQTRRAHRDRPASMPMEPEAPPEPKRNPLNEIAALMRALTYGEMMDLAEAIWNAKPEGEMTPEAMAPTLHRWSTSNGK